MEKSSRLRLVASILEDQPVGDQQTLRDLLHRRGTEVAWDDHELVAFFGSMGFEPAARLVLETEISPA